MATWTEKEAAVRSLESDGRVDPEDLIEAARDDRHPCHGDFTWDVHAAAAERWRDQARSIIRKCKFEVIVEEVTSSVVRYVSSTDDEPVFVSLPKMRGVAKTSAVMQRELQMLHGNACRVYGIAVSKAGIVGSDVVRKLKQVKESLESMLE